MNRHQTGNDCTVIDFDADFSGTDVAVEFARCFNSLFAFIERRIESKSNCSGQSGLVIGLVLSTSGLILYVSPQKMAAVPKMATSFIEWNVTNSYPITVIFIQVVHSTVINQLQEKVDNFKHAVKQW